jgi:hypothetical protein
MVLVVNDSITPFSGSSKEIEVNRPLGNEVPGGGVHCCRIAMFISDLASIFKPKFLIIPISLPFFSINLP